MVPLAGRMFSWQLLSGIARQRALGPEHAASGPLEENMESPNVNDSQPAGIERRFDLANDITAEWFRAFVAELKRYGADAGTPDCRIRRVSDIDNQIRFRDFDLWSQFVLAQWEDVAETRLWNYQGIVRRADCDHQRSQLVLELISEKSSRVEKVLEDIGLSLSLKPSRPQAYRYRRSSLEFEIGAWRPDLFADGVRDVAAILGKNPAIREAYVKTFDGKVERLTPFDTLEAFLRFVNNPADRFEEAAVRMEARSISIGIGVPSNHRRLRIRTSLAPENLKEIINAWPRDLRLNSIKAADSGGELVGVAPTTVESPLLKYGVTILLAFITAASTAGLVSLKKAVWPDYAVVITTPASGMGVTKVEGGAVPVSWYLRVEQASFRSDRMGEPATIRVYGDAGLQESVDAKSPASLPLAPGHYFIEVDSPAAKPAQFQVLLLERPASPKQKPHLSQ